MRSSKADSRNPHLWAVLILLTGLTVTWFAYAPGLSGQLHFDDYHNLEGLAKITNGESAIEFMFTGGAGPLGRPIALASFVPEAHAWPDIPSVFLRTNIAIHLINGLLVAWFLYLLGRARELDERPAAIAAAAAACIWMLMPLLASSSLFIVQRMTTLSAAFALAGATGYMHARLSIRDRPIGALFGMTFFLSIGALLAAFTKENGVLIFLFILAAEATLLKRPASVSTNLWRIWFTLVLLAPLAALLAFLISVLPYSENVILSRGFTGLERLLTQAEILWKYLYIAFVPNVGDLGPFHDDYSVRRNYLNMLTFLSVIGWIAVVVAALIFRKKAPLFAFAVAWYLLGHLLESTWLSLELYFEHRNYLPLVGPVYALMASLVNVGDQWRKLAVIGAASYATLLGAILFSTTSLWGSPVLAAEMWHIYKPASIRAAQNLSKELEMQGNPFAARRLLNRFMSDNPKTDVLKIQTLAISCQMEKNADHTEALEATNEALKVSGYRNGVTGVLEMLYGLVKTGQCPTIETSDIYRLGESILGNPNFKRGTALHNVHVVMAKIGIDQKDFDRAMNHMESALNLHRNPKTLALAIHILNSGGRSDISRRFLEQAETWPAPKNPLVARNWHQALAELKLILDKSASPQDKESLQDNNTNATE